MFRIQDNKSFDEMKVYFEIAEKESHKNSVNYTIDKMKKRWEKYLTFTLLTYYNKPLAFAGIYDYGNNLVRICDRYYVFPEYRNINLSFSLCITWFGYCFLFSNNWLCINTLYNFANDPRKNTFLEDNFLDTLFN